MTIIGWIVAAVGMVLLSASAVAVWWYRHPSWYRCPYCDRWINDLGERRDSMPEGVSAVQTLTCDECALRMSRTEASLVAALRERRAVS